jgi:glutamyl-tRNA reductase
MDILVTGINYRTANISSLEKFYISDRDLEDSYKSLVKHANLKETVILSTCNRVEIYGVTDDVFESDTGVIDFFGNRSGLTKRQVSNLSYTLLGKSAIEHLFKVTSSIDSMVVGEPQILGQVKSAFDTAQAAGCTSKVSNHLFARAIKVAKRIRTETELARKPVSIASIAAKQAFRVFNDLSGKSALLIGAGAMGQQIAAHLMGHNIKSLHVHTRSQVRAKRLAAKYGAVIVSNFEEALGEVDVVISSTSSSDFIVTKDQITAVMKLRCNRPLFLIDIAVPRDIDPDVGAVENVYVYDMDDIEKITEDHTKQREQEASKACMLIDKEVDSFISWLNCVNIHPLIANLKTKVEALCVTEMSRSIDKLRDSDFSNDALEVVAKALTKKILHDPIAVLKANAVSDENPYAEAASKLFRLPFPHCNRED